MENQQLSQIFGEYQLQEKLGSGGMASVYHAIHIESQQEVALKILHEHYADDEQVRRRLEREAEIVMRLEHPHIVPIWDFGEANKRPYLVMPYMAGGSLAAHFEKPRTIKHEKTLKILSLVAAGLDYAHSMEVVHRDFKLENILLDEKNIPAISDFGIAQSAYTSRITLTGQILGTPQYLAPENLDGNIKLNYKADLYALGVMAYLMFTGYFPFTADDGLSIAVKHRTHYAPLPSWVNSNLPSTLDPVFMRALAKQPEDRYTNAVEFVDALKTAFSDAALKSTIIFTNEPNPISDSSLKLEEAKAQTSPVPSPRPPRAQQIADEDVRLPAAAPTMLKSSVRRFVIYPFILLFFCSSACAASFFFYNGVLVDSNGESILPIFVTDGLLNFGSAHGEETTLAEGVRLTAIPTNTPTPTGSASPTASPTLTASPTRRGSSGSFGNSNPTATVTRTVTPTTSNVNNPTQNHTNPTRRPSATNTPMPTITPTPIPPTPVPPTPIPPTPIPPTPVPPTPIPPTPVPPTEIPPTEIPPTEIPPTEIPPTDPPPTVIPPTDEPPTEPPPTDPQSEEPTDEPNGSNPPARQTNSGGGN